jgi:probable HAF family extracellular repeat protein
MHWANRDGLIRAFLAVALAAPLAVGAASAAASKATKWHLIELASPRGWAACTAGAINARGQVLGVCRKGELTHPFLWDGRTVSPIGGTNGPAKFEASAVNDRGQVVGYRWTKESPMHAEPVDQRAFVWQRGKLTDLGPGWANAINNRGDVVGAAMPRFPRDVSRTAALWQGGHRILLGPSGRSSDAVGINDRGQVALNTDTPDPRERPWIWQRGKLTAVGQRGLRAESINEQGQILGSCEFSASGDYAPCGAFLWSRGTTKRVSDLDRLWLATNDRGQIVGSDTGQNFHARLWGNGKLIDLGTLPLARQSRAYAVNNRAQVIGISGNLENLEPQWLRAFVWQQGTMTELPAPGAKSSVAVAINDRGQIAGTITERRGETHAVLWAAQ